MVTDPRPDSRVRHLGVLLSGDVSRGECEVRNGLPRAAGIQLLTCLRASSTYFIHSESVGGGLLRVHCSYMQPLDHPSLLSVTRRTKRTCGRRGCVFGSLSSAHCPSLRKTLSISFESYGTLGCRPLGDRSIPILCANWKIIRFPFSH